MAISVNLSSALVENTGEHSPIRIAILGKTIVSASCMQELEEAKKSSRISGKRGCFHTRGP